ncbi:MAG: hypothetical protein KJO95_05585 [Gammaproteobacteria bacterium]|nr:hypothetical protein [Gammaproteobacteria bacterium]
MHQSVSSNRLGTLKPSYRCRNSITFVANISGTESDGEYHLKPGVISGATR